MNHKGHKEVMKKTKQNKDNIYR